MTWLLSPNVILAAVVVAGAVAIYAQQQRAAYDKGAGAVITQSKEAGKQAHAKARKAHRAARQPGAAERLLKNSCRDCQ
jgi:hypothetical protein